MATHYKGRQRDRIQYSLPLLQDHPPDKQHSKVILIKSEERVDLKRGPVKYENRDIDRSEEFWIGLGGEPEAELRDAQNEKRVRVDRKKGKRRGKTRSRLFYSPPLAAGPPP